MIEKVIEKLYPNTAFVVVGDKWESLDGTELNSELIVQGVAELRYEQEVNKYQEKRAAEYPTWGKQLDYIYHNGVDAWKTDIVDPIKTKYPKQTVDSDEVNARKAQALFDHQLSEYTKAVARLDQYQVANGRDEVTEMQDGLNQLLDSDGVPQYDSDGNPVYEQVEVITVTAIEPAEATVEQTTYDNEGVGTITSIENPLITKDSEERAAAQAIIDATPQAVIDAV